MADSPSDDGEACDGRRAVAIPSDLPEPDRRRVLGALGGAGAVALAGCLNGDDEEDDEAAATYDLYFVDHDQTVAVAEDEEILYPALEADVDIPYTCEVGSCGECTARYDGDATEVVSHDGNEYLDDDQIADGWILTCVAYAEDDFDLEVAHPDDE